MTSIVIDTNVLAVADHRHDGVGQPCIDACSLAIIEAQEKHVVLLDDNDEVRLEYINNIGMNRPFGLSAQFLIHLFHSQYNPNHFKNVTLSKNESGEFNDCPQALIDAGFDRSDRKFVALAVRGKAPVWNGTDSDWLEHRDNLAANGIEVCFLCGHE